jgi:NACHT domain/Ankyrin repeats (many copies)
MESLATWLQPAPVTEDLVELSKRRHPDTCHWIYDTLEFKSWESRKYQHLWIYGKPGSGKSVLAASFVEYLQMHDSAVAYFFCSSGDDSRQTIDSILRTWLWQLLDQMPQFVSLALENHYKGSGTQGSLAVVKSTIHEVISQCNKPVNLVVDGLDECDLTPKNLRRLVEFLVTLGQNAHVIIVSRPENWIRNTIFPLMDDKCCRIHINSSVTKDDLCLWIKNSVLDLNLPDPTLEGLAISTLQKNADGMFLWARLQLEELNSQLTIEDAKSVLQNELPMDLEATYERLLGKIEGIPHNIRRNRALHVLQWITATVRPLSVDELDFALAIQVDSQIYPERGALMRGELDILEACGSFVEITPHRQVRFVHASVRDFLRAKGIQFGLSSLELKAGPEKALCAMHTARVCMTSLSLLTYDLLNQSNGHSQNSYDAQTLLKSHIRDFFKKYPFLVYAVMHWWKHLDDMPSVDEDLLRNSVNRFLGSSEKIVLWLQLYQYLMRFHSNEDDLSHPCTTSGWLYIQSIWMGHLGTNPANLFDRWYRWHVETRFGSSSIWPIIHIAAFFNFADVVQSHLERGISPDIRSTKGFTPLLQAAHGDSPDVAKLLLDRGANKQVCTVYGYSAIRYACRNSLSTLALLVQAGCSAWSIDLDMGQTALHEVSSSVLWHPKVLQSLLNMPDLSEIINRKNFNGKTALDIARAINIKSIAKQFPQPPLSLVRNFTWKRVSYWYHADRPASLGIIYRGWQDLGVSTPTGLDFKYEALCDMFTVWKDQIIRKLVEKGAVSGKDEAVSGKDDDTIL